MVSGENRSSGTRTKGVILVAFLWILNSALRLVFGYMSATGVPLLDVEVSTITLQTINVMFFLLGIVGFIATFGFLRMKRWGFWGIILVCFATIIFDIWGLTIQYTAAIGFIVPAISILYLYSKKSQLLATMN